MKKPTIVMQTDFGINWGVVATMHGVCKRVDSELEICDATHLLPQFDTKAASYCLQYMIPYWSEGTVFVSVVDPGVGTDRKASVAKTKNGYYIVTPDNGTLTYIKEMYGIEEIREIDETVNRYPGNQNVDTFHGRDIFAYCAAKLAAGKITFEQVGEVYPVEDIIVHELIKADVSKNCAKGIIAGGGESFGNCETNIENIKFEGAGFAQGDMVNIEIKDEDAVIFSKKVLYHKSFGHVEIGEPVIFNDLGSFISIGLNQKSFADEYGITVDKTYQIIIYK
ncbi:MAG: SAM-dependent chlorinase/fluorinase [Clostridium sp.]